LTVLKGQIYIIASIAVTNYLDGEAFPIPDLVLCPEFSERKIDLVEETYHLKAVLPNIFS
jgi:hypothetical protein